MLPVSSGDDVPIFGRQILLTTKLIEESLANEAFTSLGHKPIRMAYASEKTNSTRRSTSANDDDRLVILGDFAQIDSRCSLLEHSSILVEWLEPGQRIDRVYSEFVRPRDPIRRFLQ